MKSRIVYYVKYRMLFPFFLPISQQDSTRPDANNLSLNELLKSPLLLSVCLQMPEPCADS